MRVSYRKVDPELQASFDKHDEERPAEIRDGGGSDDHKKQKKCNTKFQHISGIAMSRAK